MFNWNRLTFLESTANLKPLIRKATGRTPSTSIAREVATCLQQGRLFFQAAEASALEIRPLLLFYGTMAFSKALVVSQTLQSLSTLPRSHGVMDTSVPRARVVDLSIRLGTAGTFQRFNDVVAQLNCLPYHDHETMPQIVKLPAAPAAQMGTLALSLQDILSRVPGLDSIYRRTYRESPLTLPFTLYASSRDQDFMELRIDYPEVFRDRAGLVDLVRRLRQQFPALAQWRVVRAMRAWGVTIILFGNVAVPGDEFSATTLVGDGSEFSLTNDPETDATQPKNLIVDILSPPGGSFSSHTCLISPIAGHYISEYALHYLGMFLLSCVVRYRPQTWVHVITRTTTQDNPVDDQALALLEEFMTIHSATMPGLLADVLDPDH